MAANSETSKPIDMDDYFMAIAFLTSKLSKDPETKVGAVIVNEDNCIVGTGYNDFPSRCGDVFFWHDKKLYVVHAEANAMLNRNCASLMNTRIYTTLIPCNECAKLIKQAGISKVLYASDEKKGKKYRTSANMLTSDHIEHKLYKPKQKPIVLNFV